MKIQEIITTGRTQGSFNQQVEPNVLFSIRNLCARGGKNPETFVLSMMCRMLQMLKDGSFYKQSNPLEVNLSTDKQLLDLLRAMSPEDLCDVASKLDQLLTAKDKDLFYWMVNPTQEYSSWLKYVHSREADD